jgi:uncharacterized protein YqgQ
VAIEAAKIIISAKDETRAAFESVRGSLATITGLASALGVGALAAAVKQAANFADEMQETAEKVGITTQSLSELKYAADLSGDSFEALQTGLKRLSTNILEFSNGGKGAQELFNSIGVSAVDSSGKLRSADAVLKDVADRFATLPNGAEKTALAIQLFGKAGADLIPLLNQGSAGLKSMADEAERFGRVVDDDMAAASARFNDNLDKIGIGLDGLKLKIAGPLIDDLARLTTEFLDAASAAEGFFGALEGFTTDSGDYGQKLTEVETRLKNLKKLRAELDPNRSAANKVNDFIFGDVSALDKQIAVAEQEATTFRRLNEIRSRRAVSEANAGNSSGVSSTAVTPSGGGGATSIGNAAFAKQSQELATLIQNFQKAAEGPRTQAEDLQKTLDTYRALNPEVQTYLQGLVDQVAQRELLTKETEAWQRQQELAADFDARELDAIEQQSAAEVAKTEAMERQALAIRELLDPQLKLLNMQQEYTELLDAGLLSQEEYAAALDNLAESQKDLADNGKTSLDDLKRAVEGFSKDASSAFVDFAFTGKASFGDMIESILKDLARLAIQRSITDPLVKGLDDSGIFSNFADGFKNIFGGARAAGGPVASGKAYLVGERGPEIFMPSASGTIIPNGAGGGGMNVSVSVDASGSRAQGDGDQALAVGNAIGEAVRAELLRQRRPGGLLG